MKADCLGLDCWVTNLSQAQGNPSLRVRTLAGTQEEGIKIGQGRTGLYCHSKGAILIVNH